MWFKYPYTSYSVLNLDWFLSQFKIIFDGWTEQKADYEQFKNDITEEFNTLSGKFDTLKETVETFTTFIENYFDNLDVQQEINNKLDEMLADGTLEALIQPMFNTLVATVNESVEEQTEKIAVLEGRMDAFSSLAEGSTTGDAELMDIRVSGDGVTYPTAGDAVRAQFDDVSANLKTSVFSDGYGDFILLSQDYEFGAISASDGTNSGTNPSRIRTNIYIPSYENKIRIYLKNNDYSGFVSYYTANGSGFVERKTLNYTTPFEGSGGFYRIQLAKSDGTNFSAGDIVTAHDKVVIRNYALFTQDFGTTQFSLDYANVKSFIDSAAYDPDDYSYTQVPSYITSQNALNDKPLPVILKMPESTTSVKRQVIVSTVHSYSPSAPAPCNIYTFKGTDKFAEIYNLIPGKTYYYWIWYTYADGTFAQVADGTFKTKSGSHVRMINADHIQNVRDIGGWTGTGGAQVKYGQIIRGSSMNEEMGKNLCITDEGIDILTKYLNVGWDIDLRSSGGLSPLGYGITTVSAPIANYANMISNPSNVATAIQGINAALAAGKTAYVHCQGGCDRTGSLITIILALAGVSESDLAKEYELSCFSKIGGGRYRSSTSYDYKGMIAAIKALPGADLQAKVEGWLLTAGLNQSEIDDLKSYLI